LKLRAAPAAKDVLDAIEVLRGMNSDNARKVPADAPTNFIKPRWPAPCSLTGWAKSATAALSSNAIGPAALIW
ncbi:MAG: hypothetical protein KGM99_12835, partial [Burkholderiales bacterium]|nr:hypothetical protein [Burkholderiales bacterium]